MVCFKQKSVNKKAVSMLLCKYVSSYLYILWCYGGNFTIRSQGLPSAHEGECLPPLKGDSEKVMREGAGKRDNTFVASLTENNRIDIYL